MKLTQEQVEGFAQSPRQVDVEEVADLCDDWLAYRERVLDLELAIRAVRPFVQNITLRAVLDEAMPREKPMT